jgi:1-acyl-sn-glycerol-3-phosphate acyltransferase
MIRRIIRAVLYVFFHTVAVVDVVGMENVPAQGAFVAVSNHLGRLDPALVYYLLTRKDVYLLVAEKYQKYALARWLVRLLDGLFIDRYNADFRALRVMLERLQNGGVLALAPEGTRSRSVALIHAWPGASYLAAKAGVPVLPVAITGTEDVVVKDRLRHFKRIHIHLRIGKPFMLPELRRQDRDKILQQSTDEMMCQIAALLPPAYRGVYADHSRLAELLQNTVPQA